MIQVIRLQIKALAELIYIPMSPGATILGLIAALISWLYGDLTLGIGILIFITVGDFITGLLKAGKNGEIESSKMARTAFKLAAYVTLIAILHVFFRHYLPIIPGIDPETSLIPATMLTLFNLVPHFIIAILVLRELNSNIENLAAGGYIPQSAAKMLGRVLSKVGDSIQKNQDQIAPGDSDKGPGKI